MYEVDASNYLAKNGLTDADLASEINSYTDWFHRVEFTNGLVTPGRDPSAQKLRALQLPDRMDGLSVIDVGALDGYFSLMCERRGAARVVATDKVVWDWPGSTAVDRFRFLKRVTESQVEEHHISCEELSPATVGEFDVSLFLGVLYHAPNMIEYLQKVRSITKRLAIIETLVDMLDVDEPCAAFYPLNALLNNDPSNHWGPNLACVEGMLARCGFSTVAFIGMWDANTRATLDGSSSAHRLKSGRAVWHAYV